MSRGDVRARPSQAPASLWEALERALSPTEERPRVVQPLEAAPQTTRGGLPYVVVRNPLANTYLKLDPREYDLLPLMDGSRTIKELVIAYFQRHGTLAPTRIAALVQLLRANRLLAHPSADALAELADRLRRARSDNLLSRLARAFPRADLCLRDVDALLGRWYRAWGWLFFTRPLVVVGAILGLSAPLLFGVELLRGRYDLFRFGDSHFVAILLLLGLGALALAAHELGHALAVKHAGRSVTRAGLSLYYGLPAAYVDTSDIWMAPRSRRLIASLAGPWAGLVVGGVCALGTLLLPTGLAGAVLFTAAFVFLVDNLLNFNPLLELDGYYLLVDYLDKPMLRARALTFVRDTLWTRLRRGQRLTDEERFFAIFGLAVLAWSALTIGLALRFWELRVGPLLEEIWQSGDLAARVALAVLAGLVVAPLVVGLWRLAVRLLGWLGRARTWLGGRAAVLRHRQALEALRAVPLWAALPDARLLEVARAMRVQDVAAGTEVVRQGEPGDRFYIIASGVFEVLVDGSPVARLGRGDYFGERALLYNTPRAATVLAVDDGRVFWLDQRVFHETLAHDVETRARLEAALAYRAQLAEMPLFSTLSPVEMDLLLARMTPIRVDAGQEVVRQEEAGDRFYVVRSGSLEVSRDGQWLATLGPGESFGEIALLFEVPRTATVRATTPADLLALSASDFHDLLVGYCGRAAELERLSHLRLETHRRLDQVAR